MARLVRPSSRYKESYLEALREFQAEGRYVYYDIGELRADFESFVDEECARIHHENIAPYRVPETIYWLVEDDEFIGRLELRHELNDHLLEVGGHIGYSIRPGRREEGYGTRILRAGLEKAREADLDRVLLTCDPDNVASRKIIEKCGGQFEDRVDVVREGVEYHKLRYWIDLARQLRHGSHDAPSDERKSVR